MLGDALLATGSVRTGRVGAAECHLVDLAAAVGRAGAPATGSLRAFGRVVVGAVVGAVVVAAAVAHVVDDVDRPGDDLEGELLAREQERDHAAEPSHLAGGRLVTRVVGESRVEDAGDRRVSEQELDHPLGVVAVPVHPYRQGLDAP